jgi:hypothetical protein
MLLALIGALVLLLQTEHSLPRVALSDGTIFQVEKVTYGTNHTYATGSSIVPTIRSMLPKALRNLLPRRGIVSPTTSEPAIWVWYRQIDPVTKETVQPTVRSISFKDAHGCAFRAAGNSSSGNSLHNINCIEIPMRLPGRGPTFKLVGLQPDKEGEFQIELSNPHRYQPNVWRPEPFPITNKVGEAEFVCIDVAERSPTDWERYQAHFKVIENGIDRTDCYNIQQTIVDEMGNRSERGLCRYDLAWKLQVFFYKDHRGHFPQGSITHIPIPKLPVSGAVHSLSNLKLNGRTNLLHGALCGPGDYTFSNGLCIAAAPWQADWRNEAGPGASITQANEVQHTFRRKKLTLLLDVKGLESTAKLLVGARDNEGIFHPLRSLGGLEHALFYEMEYPAETGEHLEIIYQTPISVEFMIKPPLQQTGHANG